MMFVCSFFLAFHAARDYYVARNGTSIQGRVIDISAVCKAWNKYITVEYAGQNFNIRLYGPECRVDEFPKDRLINLRTNSSGNIVVLEANRYSIRLWFFIPIFFLALIVCVLMYNQYRFWKHDVRVLDL